MHVVPYPICSKPAWGRILNAQRNLMDTEAHQSASTNVSGTTSATTGSSVTLQLRGDAIFVQGQASVAAG